MMSTWLFKHKDFPELRIQYIRTEEKIVFVTSVYPETANPRPYPICRRYFVKDWELCK